MQESPLELFGAWQKANELFDLTVCDMDILADNPKCGRLAPQQVGAVDSICANIEEGYGRSSKNEYAQFLVIARGSTQEAKGRYYRLRHFLPPRLIEQRRALCDEIIGILTASIQTLRRSG